MMDPTSYYARHRAAILSKRRRTLLTTRGGQVIRGLKKRPHTIYCELCIMDHQPLGRRPRLEYHHWIPNRPNIGLWLCFPHHKLVELIDDPLFPRYNEGYQALKATIERQFNVRYNARPPGPPK